MLTGLLSFAAFTQTTRTRPRVVVTDGTSNSGNQPNSPAPSGTPTPTPTGAKQPPVLINDSKSTPTPKPGESGDLGIIDDDEVIKVETNLVTLPVTVLDRDGRFVTGLQQNDFSVFEDGVQQKIEYFASLEQPFTVVLLLDVSNSTQFKIDEIQNAAITFVNQLRQNDRVMVISFDEKVHVLAQPTNDRRILQNAIRQISFGGGTSLYEAVSYSIKQELSRYEGRKAVVLFTDGVDTTSKRDTYLTTIKDAEEFDAMIYPIRFDTQGDMQSGSGSGGISQPSRRSGSILGAILTGILTGGNVQIGSGGGNGRSSSEYENGKRYLEDLAKVTGGRNFEARTIANLDAAFSGIAEELRRQYSVGYYPEKEGKPGDRKQIRIRVDRENAVVRAKNNYIVGANSPSSTAKQTVKPAPKQPARRPF